MKSNHEPCLTIVALLLIAVMSIVIWTFQSKMEANAYNRITGSDVTTWEAMWVQLRIEGTP